jgi:thioredoxin reductase (NADPH)
MKTSVKKARRAIFQRGARNRDGQDFVGDAGAGAGESAGVVTAAHVVLAVGGRPHVPSAVPGAHELAITSDDLWSLPVAPGRTLCVGGGYVALECAGLLRALGMDVSVCARSVLLRGFDRDCADKVGEVMARRGVRFLEAGRAPTAIARRDDGRLDVAFADGGAEAFDTVLYATGRRADTGGLGLQHVEGLEATRSCACVAAVASWGCTLLDRTLVR